MNGSAQTTAESARADLILAQLDELPTLDPTILRILKSDHSADIRQRCRALAAGDARLSAALESIEPSSQQVERSENHEDEACEAAIALSLVRLFARGHEIPGEGLNHLDFWQHSLAVGCAARRVATATGLSIDPLCAFVLGLLHDIGRIALDVALPKSYARVLRADTSLDLVEREQITLGLDHCTAGRHLAERWELPARAIDCIWLHHQALEALPNSVAIGRHVQLVQLADAIACELRIGDGEQERLPLGSAELASILGLSAGRLQLIAESVQQYVADHAKWLQLAGNGPDFQKTHERLAAGSTNPGESRAAGYLDAIHSFTRSLNSKSTVRDLCRAGASALRRALGVSNTILLASRNDGCLDVGIARENFESHSLEWQGPSLNGSNQGELIARMGDAGLGIAPPPREFDAVVDRFRGELGSGRIWMLPIARESSCAICALFTADDDHVATLREEMASIAGLTGTIGLAIAHARQYAAAMHLLDELAEGSRRGANVQADAIRSRTLESIVAMAAGAAHELNNPLAVISGRAQMLAAQAGDPSVTAGLDTIMRKAQECSDIVTDLMEFAMPRDASPETIELKEMLETLAAELISQALLEPEQLALEISSDRAGVWFDRQQLSQLFRELLLNAIEATSRDERRLTVKVADDVSEEICVVTLADNGRGMTPEVLRRAFDPFFSHRPAGRGRGLGLARAQRYVQAGGGTIRIESTPGRGTRVELRLKIKPGDAA